MPKPETIYRVARSREELEAVFSLVYKEYLRRGYIPKEYKSRLRISFHNALPRTATFIGLRKSEVVAGVSFIPDSPVGLPMDKLYKPQLDELRKEGRRIAEVSQLSVANSLFGSGFYSMFNFNKLIFVFKLFKVVLDYALDMEKIDDLCIAVNPKHQYLYKFLYFEPIGGLKYYGSVNRAPALAFRLKLDECEGKCRERKGLQKIFFGSKTEGKDLEGKFKLSLEDMRYFFVRKSDIFEKAGPQQLDYLKSCYPEYPLDTILTKIH